MINEDRKKLYDALSSEYDLGTYEEFERNIGDSVKRKKLYDAASADYDLGDFESYSQRIGPTHKESLDAFTAEHGSWLNDFEARESAETKNMVASLSSGLYMPSENAISGEERKRYVELHKQEEALKKAWFTSDEYLAQKDADAQFLSTVQKDLSRQRVEYAQANPAIKQEGLFQINPYAVRGVEADAELEKFATASRIMDDAIKMHNAPSRYDDKNVFLKFGRGAGDVLSDADFWTAGLTEIADNLGVRDVLSTIQEKRGDLNDLSEEAIENILSPAEKAVLQAWAIYTQEQLKRKDDLSRAYQAGQGATESLAYMAEFALTGGIGKAATEGVEQMVKWLGKKALTKVGGMTDDVAAKVLKETGEKIAQSTLGKYGVGLAESLAEAAGRTGVMPSTFRNISEKATEIETDENGNNYLVKMNDAFAKGYVDSFIENLSEGGRVNALGTLFGDVAGKIPAYKKMVDKFSHTKASELWDAFNSSGVMNTLRAGGWHGLGEEYLEEWYGNALRTLTGVDKEALKDFATVDNQIVTLTSFLPMTIFGGTVSTAQVLSANKDLEKKAAALKSALMERGYDEAQANNMIDMMRGAAPAEVSETLTPIVNSVANRNTDEAAALMKPVGEFAAAVQRWQSFNTKYNYQEQEQRDGLRAQMEEDLGQFWQQDENGRQTVQRGVNEKGEVVYMLGKPSVEDVEAGVTSEVAAVTSDGRKVFVNPSEYQLEDELEMNTFLGNEIMAEKGNQEQARMIEEKEAKIAAIRETAVPGTAVNIGTAEAPMQAIVLQRNPDGVIVNTPDGQTRQMTYEEFGNYVGVNAVPMTDAQIDEHEADVLTADRAQREAALDQEYENEDAALEELSEAEDEIEQAVDTNTPLPMKADGSVDQTALWNNDPERWAQWNDEQRQDGGANSLAYVSGAIVKEQAKIAELQAAYATESDFDARDAIEKEIADTQARVERLTAIQQGYVAQAEVAAAPAKSEYAQTELDQSTPVTARQERTTESVLASLSDGSLTDEEIRANIDANLEEAQKAYDKYAKKAPKMGIDKDAYLAEKKKYEEGLPALQQEIDFWNGVKQTYEGIMQQETLPTEESFRPELTEEDMEPHTPQELAARELGLKEGGIKLLWDSVKAHTGFGNGERQKFFGIFRSKDKGGITIEAAGDRLMEIDREYDLGLLDQSDPMAGVNAILDVLGDAQTLGDLRNYIANNRETQVAREAAAAFSAMNAEFERTHGMTMEEWAHANEVQRIEIMSKSALTDAEEYERNVKFAEQENQYGTNEQSTGTEGVSGGENQGDAGNVEGGSDSLHRQGDSILQEAQSDYTGGETISDGQTSQDVSEGNDQDGDTSVYGSEQTAEIEDLPYGVFESSLDEYMPDFTNSAAAYFPSEEIRRKFSAMRARINDWAQKLGVQVRIMETLDDVVNQSARKQILKGAKVYGYFDLATGEVAFYLPDFLSLNGRELTEKEFLSEIDRTYIHEVVAHRGLRGLLGEEKYGELCDMVWNAMTKQQKAKFLNYPGVNGNTRTAADELIAHFAENVDYNDNRTLWDKIVDFIKDFFNSVELPAGISNESLAELLRHSYRNLAKSAASIDTNANQQAEGNTVFRASNNALVGMHNISEDKLRKVLKQGGLANPSTAVVNIAEYMLDGFGAISLIMPSSLVDATTGDNIGTYTGDAWTPTYPPISRKIDKNGWKTIKDIIRSVVPEDSSLYYNIINGLENYLDDNRSSKMEFVFLKEKGIEPEIAYEGADGFVGMRNLEAVLGVQGLRDGLESYERYKNASSMAKRSFNMWLDSAGNKQAYKELKEQLKKEPKLAEVLKLNEDVSFAEFDSFTDNIFRKEQDAGKIDTYDTLGAASRYVDANNLRGEFEAWLESLMEQAGAKEVFFAGYTRDGDRIYKDNTLENVSRYMRLQGRVNAYDDHGLSATKSALLQRLTSLSQIRKNKARLQSESAYNKEYDELKDRLWSIISQLADMQEISSNQFMNVDYAESRLQDAITKKNPVEYLNKEYGYEIDPSGEYAEEIKSFIKDVQKMPAKYFETKFERPVYLNEFVAAVMPTTTSEDIKQAVSEAGLPIFEYDSAVEGSRKEATLKATEDEGIRFRTLGEKGAANLDKVEEATIRLDNLGVARQMEEAGKDARAIKLATGWERGADNLWRYEVADDFDLAELENKLQENLNDGLSKTWGVLYPSDLGDLTKAYPDFNVDIMVWVGDEFENTGEYSPATEGDETTFGRSASIEVKAKTVADIKDVLVHEIQHAIQEKEGFAEGGSVFGLKDKLSAELDKRVARIKELRAEGRDAEADELMRMSKGLAEAVINNDADTYQNYRKLAGEVEARNVSARLKMSEQERRESLLSETEDVAREDQIILMDGLGVSEMGSRVDKRMLDIENELSGITMTEAQKTVYNVFIGKQDKQPIAVQRKDGVPTIIMEQGAENKSGAKHAIFKHYGTGSGSFTAKDVLLIPEIVNNGTRKQDGNKVVYELTKDGVRYRVVTYVKTGNEIFNNFYTNRKNQSSQQVNAQKSDTQSALASEELASVDKDTNNSENGNTLFRTANNNQRIFISNAEKAVEGIQMGKATPEQWLKMLEKNGGLKAGEDKWLGLSDWLKASDKKSITREELLQFINENMIQIEEQHYSEDENALDGKRQEIQEALQGIFDEYVAESEDMNDDMFMKTHYDYAIQKLADELGYTAFNAPFMNNNAVVELDFYEDDLDTLHELSNKLGLEKYDGTRNINDTRLSYTTEGLTDRHEIALTVPTIEPWNKSDEVHFGDAGDGRAVAWIRFGDTKKLLGTTEIEGKKKLNWAKVLVIDEIQSKRHQEGRERGYISKKKEQELRERFEKAKDRFFALDKTLRKKYGNDFANAESKDEYMEVLSPEDYREYMIAQIDFIDARLEMNNPRYDAVPDAPFDKNWHELAMKRMLRYAAENGYDVIAWTKGEQQSERYNIGHTVANVDYRLNEDGTYRIDTMNHLGYQIESVPTTFSSEQEIAEIFGKDIARKIVGNLEEKKLIIEESKQAKAELKERRKREGFSVDSPEYDAFVEEFAKIDNRETEARKGYTLSETDFRIGGEGMKGFYDRMLPAFMNKYGKKWGVKVEDMTFPGLEGGLTMHSISVTEEMKESVMEGQTMFRTKQPQEFTRQFMVDAVNDFTDRYNTFAPSSVVYVKNRKMVAAALGIEQEALTDDLYSRIKKEAETSPAYLLNIEHKNEDGTVDAWRKILIFANDNIQLSSVVDWMLFHENTHAILQDVEDKAKALKLGEWLLQSDNKHIRKMAEWAKANYEEGDRAEEMLCEYVGKMLAIGKGQWALDLVPDEYKPILNEIYEKFGYNPEREDGRRDGEISRDVRELQMRNTKLEGTDSNRTLFKTAITPVVRREMDAISATAIVRGNYLKAPNGAYTNLTPEQWAMVRTENFKIWFGDWENDPANASKVVDENGEPMVVYHGTQSKFTAFDVGYKGKNFGFRLSDGFYFSPDETVAESYASFPDELKTGEVKAVFLNIINPFHIKSAKDYREQIKEIASLAARGNRYQADLVARMPESKLLSQRGYDGVVEKRTDEITGEIVVFDPNQIKSATDNTGVFSVYDDIRFRTKYDVNTNPTEAQKKAGNYKMGHIRLDGYNITIENPKGSVRRGTDSKGNAWENTLNNDYGYIRGTEGVDGDHIDVYLSDNPTEGNVFVIDQVNPETREFDEHKVMYGFNSAEEAREAYLANFNEEWNGLGTITEVSKDEFKKWIESSHRKTKPFREYKSVRANEMQATDESELRYRVVSDQETLDRLNSEPTIKVYRAMQLIDGKLYPPMSAKVDGELRQPIELGQWEEAEERPDLVDEKGRFKLDKGNKSSLKARYNPYFHTSPTPLNDQFSSAQTRPELVTVEVEVPESELTSGYKAEKAKDSVGKMEWKAGVVQSKLSGTRTVILSRWDKPVRIVPDSEVADVIVDMFEGRDITMPSNVVTPPLRAELEKRGVPFVETDNQGNPVEEVSSRVIGNPTDEVVANGLQLTPAQTAEVAANIFAALPEESRKRITEGLNGNILGLKDAILQIPTSLASKENWNEEDKQMADVVAEEMTKMAGEMTRPFSAEEGLWLLYNNLNKGTDLISQASRALVQRNLGFDAETLAKQEQAKEDVRFRTVGDATSNAQASLYNRGAVNVWTRLKESFVDMQASVEELVKAIEKRTGKVAQGFENILLALNQQSSKGLAAMESYTQKFLNPMFDEIRRIMDETKMKYEDVVRYVILKHGLERNKKLAQRDARAHYQEIYDDIISKITGMTAAQKRTYLTNAQLKDGDAKAELATLQAVDMSAMTDEEKREHKKKLAAARKAVEEAEEYLKRAQKIASLSEQEAQDELDKIFEKIENGTDSVFKEMRENDYSGISSMFYDQLGVDRKDFSTEEQYQAALMEAKKDRYSSLKDIEAAAEAEVKSFEGKTDTKELWKRINAATKETLRQQYEANMISKDQYLNLRDMFEYYVPLRGFKDNTAEDMYTYYRKPNSTGYTKPILGAEGRKTEAESPFGWIAAMAGSAIASNVKNEAKLALYYFVSNRPENGIATISKTWFVDSGEVDERGKKIFKPAYPPFSEDLSSAEGKTQYEIWQANMKELQKKGQAYEAGQRLNLGNAVVNISDANKPEHIVNVKVGGKDYTIIINGNPRAAQAINGDLNIEGIAQDYSALFGPVLRWMSSVNTSYNPEFWITNMMRDMAFTWMAVNIKEDPAYRRKFSKNYRKAFKVISLVAKNEKGTIGDSYLEQQYKDFVKYGGVTGYTQIKDSETWEKEIENYLSSNDPESVKNGKVMRGMKSAFHAAHRFGESLEQVSRFAAFLTARETGKSINEAIDDAKEITVNFNRKGSGKMITLEEAKYLTGKNGQPLTKPQQWMVVGLSSIAPLGRRFIMFFNAAIQGLNATYKLMKKNPKRFTGWALGYAAVGMMNAVLHAMLDDDDDYLDIPQYERRNSLMIGGNGAYIKWALPQEARAFYALGDLAVETVMGRNPHQNFLGEALKIGTEILPVNPSEGWKAFMPSVAIPAIELMLNEDYKGAPIYNEQKWLSEEEKERTAKWSNAYQGTGWTYVKIAQGLNFITGGDKHDAGLINLQPEKLEHLVQSAFGGTIRTADKFINTISAAIDPEEPMTIRQTPFLNRFLTINDERFKNVHVNDVFDYYKADAEHALTLEKQYIKDRDMDSLTKLRSSDEYQWAKIYGKYKKPLKAIQDKIKVADGTAEKKELMKQQDELKKRMIKEISEL